MGPLYSNENSDSFIWNSAIFNQRGQATTEYVLLLVVVVAIFAMASARLFTPVKKWADFYMGDYTYCLIDNGELPRELGGNPVECEQLQAQNGFDKASVDKRNADQAQADAAARAKAKAQAAAQQAQGARKVRGYRGSSSSGSYNPADFSNPNRPKGGADGGGSSVRQVARLENNSRKDQIIGSDAAYYKSRTVAIDLPAEYAHEQEKIMRREAKVSQVVAVSDTDRALTIKKLKMKTQIKRKDASINASQDDGFSFGGMLRMAIIFGILAVVIFLIGSQINSVMKGMD
jgi:hypothetical protein